MERVLAQLRTDSDTLSYPIGLFDSLVAGGAMYRRHECAVWRGVTVLS
jgi:hypothetical protein